MLKMKVLLQKSVKWYFAILCFFAGQALKTIYYFLMQIQIPPKKC